MTKVIGFYGSWRAQEDSKIYKLAVAFGEIAAKHNLTVLTGAYSGIMEAAPRGAKSCGGNTLGYSWRKLDNELSTNSYLDTVIPFVRPEERIARVVGDADICVFFPGRTGTVAELALATEMRAKREIFSPLVMVGDFWSSFFTWLNGSNRALDFSYDKECLNDLYVRIDNLEMFEQFIKKVLDQ